MNVHMRQLLKSSDKGKSKVSKETPVLSNSTRVWVLYTYDIMDKMKRRWLKLKPSDEYDGL